MGVRAQTVVAVGGAVGGQGKGALPWPSVLGLCVQGNPTSPERAAFAALLGGGHRVEALAVDCTNFPVARGGVALARLSPVAAPKADVLETTALLARVRAAWPSGLPLILAQPGGQVWEFRLAGDQKQPMVLLHSTEERQLLAMSAAPRQSNEAAEMAITLMGILRAVSAAHRP